MRTQGGRGRKRREINERVVAHCWLKGEGRRGTGRGRGGGKRRLNEICRYWSRGWTRKGREVEKKMKRREITVRKRRRGKEMIMGK